MKQTTVLFDATNIVESLYKKKVNRAGIFWVAYNILKQFGINSQYKTILLVPLFYKIKKDNELNNFILSFSSIKYFDVFLFYRKIEFFLYNLLGKKIIIKYFLKIIFFIFYVLINPVFKIKSKYLKNIEIYFTPVYTIPDFIKNNPKIISFHILHDAIANLKEIPCASPIESNFWYSNMIRGLNKDTYYFCVSECTKRDFYKLFPNQLDEKKMFVTENASAYTYFPDYNKTILEKTLKKYGIEHKQNVSYIFSFCSIDPRKNLIFTIRCFIKFIKKHNIDNLYFYLGGAHFPEYINIFNQEIIEFNDYKEKIIKFGYIDDEDVNTFYSNSLFFTYLSQYEGFGMPVLEAMQAGTPVICSNNSSLPEVTGDAAVTITYNDEEACIKAFEDFYFNENLRKEYTEKGLERAKLFSWEKTFIKMSNIIQKAIC